MRRYLLAPLVALLGWAQPVHAHAQKAAQPEAAEHEGCAPVRVHFAFDKAVLSAADKTALARSAQCLKDNQRLVVSVQGNTDKRGTQAYNLALGERRAHAVLGYLEEQGASPKQLQTISFGKDNPICDQATESCWQRNRRAAIQPACRL